MNRRSVLALIGCAAAVLPALAHDPKHHGFSLVEMARPIPAPDFEVPDPHGRPLRLSSFRGRVVVLNFWATWCPPCLAEMPSLQALHDRLEPRGLSVVALSSDEQGASVVVPFLDKLGIDFPVGLDSDGAVAKTYAARDLPLTFVVDREGRVRAAAKGERDWASEASTSWFDEFVAGP